jgi:glycosyltransferase involved in cell wall biosynthesis
LGKWTLQTADWVISFTKRERDLTVAAGASPERAVVIPNGVNTKLFRPMAREPIPKSVLWTGRYVEEKGLTYLLKAAKLVLRDVPEAKFILVGYGEQLPLLERFSEQLGLQSRVTFMAPKPQEEIVAILNRCTMFALPSLSEGFPNTVLEAMSCGKPVLVTSGIGLEEIVGDAGLYAKAGIPRSIADRIISILKNERLAEDLGSHGRTRVCGMYDWEKTVKETTHLFERAIKR